MDELVQLDALLERLRLKRNDLKEKSTDFIVPLSVNFLQTLHRPFSSFACQKLNIYLVSTLKRTTLSRYLLEPFAVIGER